MFHMCLKSVHREWWTKIKEGMEMVYLRTHSTHFIYGYMVSEILQDD